MGRTAGGVIAIHGPVPLGVSWVCTLLAILRLRCLSVVLLVRHLCNRHTWLPWNRAA